MKKIPPLSFLEEHLHTQRCCKMYWIISPSGNFWYCLCNVNNGNGENVWPPIYNVSGQFSAISLFHINFKAMTCTLHPSNLQICKQLKEETYGILLSNSLRLSILMTVEKGHTVLITNHHDDHYRIFEICNKLVSFVHKVSHALSIVCTHPDSSDRLCRSHTMQHCCGCWELD